jgi:hypothetical protein
VNLALLRDDDQRLHAVERSMGRPAKLVSASMAIASTSVIAPNDFKVHQKAFCRTHLEDSADV